MRLRTSRDERGAVLVLTGFALVALLAFTSLALDLGYQRVVRRDMQALADLVALDLVRMVDGRTVTQIEADPLWLRGRNDSVARNADTQGDPPTVTPVLGSVDPATRAFTPMTGSQVPNAVKVTAAANLDFKFRPGSGKAARSAIAGGDDATLDYQLGSFLAGLSTFQNGLLQRLLSQAFCPDGTGSAAVNCRAALDVLSYAGLVNTRLTLGALATQMGLGSADQLLASNVSVRELLQASAALLPAGAPPTASATLNGIAANVASTTQVRLGDFINVDQGNGADAANASVDVLGLILGSAFLIDGDNLVSLPQAVVNVPNVTNMTVRLRVIETVQYKYGARVGDALTTGQIQLDVTTTLANISVVGLLGLLGGTQTISLTVGGATATPTLTRCAAPRRAEIGVTPQPVSVTASQALSVLGLVNVTVNGAGGQLTGTTQVGGFNYPTQFLPSIGSGTTQRLGSTSLGLSGFLRPTTTNVTLLGIGLNLGTVVNNLTNALNPVLANIDNLLIDPLAKALGLNLGGGDVGAIDLHCTGAVLLAG